MSYGSSYTSKTFPRELNMLNVQDFTKRGEVSKSHSALSSNCKDMHVLHSYVDPVHTNAFLKVHCHGKWIDRFASTLPF